MSAIIRTKREASIFRRTMTDAFYRAINGATEKHANPRCLLFGCGCGASELDVFRMGRGK